MYKPFFERGNGAILPSCDGPFQISSLSDALTGECIGKPVAISRLVRFNFPSEYAIPTEEERPHASVIDELYPKQHVAVFFATRVHVAEVVRVFGRIDDHGSSA